MVHLQFRNTTATFNGKAWDMTDQEISLNGQRKIRSFPFHIDTKVLRSAICAISPNKFDSILRPFFEILKIHFHCP